MSGTETPSRVTRSRSHHSTPAPALAAPIEPPTTSTFTSAGPPIPNRNISKRPSRAVDAEHPCNPFQVDLVIPFDISQPKDAGADRNKAQAEVREGYETLLKALEGEGGLRVASRPGRGGKGKEEVWVFVSAGDEKVVELVEREQLLDESHNLCSRPHPVPAPPATRIRLLYDLLTAPSLQHGLGITPGQGKWSRVKSIMALHDEEADREWLEKWMLGGDWQIGLLRGLGDDAGAGLGDHQPPPVHLYFDFLTTYTLSLLPLSIICILVYLYFPADSYPPLYAVILSLYATTFVAFWRIRERKLAVRWGTRDCETVAVGRLRPEYVANLGLEDQAPKDDAGVDAIRGGNTLLRDVKVAVSAPVILACGVGLGLVLMGIFVLEAFVGHVYDGFGKQVVPLVPTALFVLVVPQVVGAHQKLAKALVNWEDHPTPVGAEKSLTAKTFAMNGIVAYLGLFLSAYIYVPFGPFIMNYVQQRLSRYDGGKIDIKTTPEKAGLGPRTSGQKQHEVKAGRLKGQLFAYTVTNQAVNLFLEAGLPFILRYVNEVRSGKASVKETLSRHQTEKKSEPEDPEKRFLDKVERELALPDYNLFTDYAEMVTQFGYITVWSIVWPLAPVFAFVNNYIEIRSDALKISKHVRQPIGDRVETIGSWLDTLSIISWIGAITNATLIYLFRPSAVLFDQTPNPNVPTHGSIHLYNIVSTYSDSPTLRTILPTFIPLALIALAASHGYLVLRWIVNSVAERVLWRGSPEEMEVQKLRARNGEATTAKLRELGKKQYASETLRGGFWNGGEEGAREIGRVTKSE